MKFFITETISFDSNIAKSSIRIKQVCRYILSQYAEDITLSEVAEVACLSPEAFCRYFKKHTGQTFISYLNDFRVKKACELLVTNEEELSVSNIAYTCGFTSVSNFNRMFKRIVGVSPSSYVAGYVDKYVAAEQKYDEAI